MTYEGVPIETSLYALSTWFSGDGASGNMAGKPAKEWAFFLVTLGTAIESGKLREVKDCPECTERNPDGERHGHKSGPCWRCHGERIVLK